MDWFLIISMLHSDEILVKHTNSYKECIKLEKQFNAKIKNRHKKDIDKVYCEQGELFESYDVGGSNSDEML